MTTDDFQQDIAQLLHSLGITENYKGFSPTVHAVQLTISDPSRLQLITKLIYFDVAKSCGSTWTAVERNMRTVASVAWANNPLLLSKLAGRELTSKPSNTRFLSILASSFSSDAT